MPDSSPGAGADDWMASGGLQLMSGETSAEAASTQPGPSKGILRQLGRGFLYVDRAIGAALPESLNPLLHSGAIAIVTFLIAAVTGIVLLIWYRPSVTLAYESVEAMSAAPLTAGLMRSLHRYSSDACLFFGLIHAVRVFLEGRFGSARWLAWVTGGSIMALLWAIGWSGYWLVWDMRAQLVAVATAKFMDVLPIFSEPIGRSFLTDEGMNSLLFFVVFFFHMLVPLAFAFVAWLHIARLSRARFLTQRPMTLWVFGMLLLLCALYPAASAAPAQMTRIPTELSMDWWYLLPLVFTERMGGGALWVLVLVPGAVFFSIPWWLAGRRPEPASVVVPRCNECSKCYDDCPYAAIEMIARTDGSTVHQSQAFVIEAKCVSCGICTGSCDTAAIGTDSFGSIAQRRRIEGWLKDATALGESPLLGFICAESAGADLNIDPETGISPELEGYRLLRVPCAGWVHPLMVERALRHGAAGVLIVTCGPGECLYREGALWTEERMAGRREPALRSDKVSPEQVTLLGLDRTRKRELLRQARSLRDDPRIEHQPGYGPAKTLVAATLLALFAGGLTGLVSDLGYASPKLETSQLVVSFSHPGAVSENCRTLSEEELAERPVHMRKALVCDRRRSPVRLRVLVDGVEAVRRSEPPAGVWKDGNSVAVERISLDPGEHRVSVDIGESADPDEWTYRDERTLRFTTDARRVVIFDRVSGFGWH